MCARFRLSIHVQGNGRLRAGGSHPDSRAIMFEEGKYSRRRIMDLLSAISGFRNALKTISSLAGERADYRVGIPAAVIWVCGYRR